MKLSRSKLMVGTLVIALAAWYAWSHRMGVPEDFADQQTQFKYGSIGTDHPLTRSPIPYWIWRVLPQMFTPSKVIKAGFGPANDLRSYTAFGLAYEDKVDPPRGAAPGPRVFERPIGISKRTAFGLDFVGVNCSFCHTTMLRKSADDKQALIIPGGTGNTIDIEKYFLYLFAAFSDPGFTGDAVMAEIAKVNPQMGFVEKTVYRYVLIPYMKHVVPDLLKQFDFIDPENPDRLPKFGPGRVDTWAAYKRTFVHPPQDDKIAGVADFPPIWNQEIRLGMRLHWDGNTNVLEERNIISALALIGPRLEYMDVERLKRVTDYSLGLLPPRYNDLAPDVYSGKGENPEKIAKRQEDITAGRVLFENRCAGCHSPTGSRIGRVEPLQYGQATEPDRVKAFTHELADSLNKLETKAWKLRDFKPQEGYTNLLLDGIWLRGPYLHNGSVPTLADLLEYPENRPKAFCRGSDVFDWVKVGFVSELSTEPGKPPCGQHFLFETKWRGNGNQGHLFGTDASKDDKRRLIEFLKTL
ncbi:MAG: hypothetical protein IPP87_09185 [Ideonella sp.]|nr:hypothetical protein [Ideonella sp.]